MCGLCEAVVMFRQHQATCHAEDRVNVAAQSYSLLDNALDAISHAGKIRIKASTERNRVAVCISDDGPGIAPDVLPKIFDPFFTTKPAGQGTGLGLDIARRLLRRYNADISVQSRPGRTEFRLSLVAEKQALAQK